MSSCKRGNSRGKHKEKEILVSDEGLKHVLTWSLSFFLLTCDSETERLHPISLLQFMALLVLGRVNSSYVKINLLHQEIVTFAFNYRKDTSHAE